MCVQLYLLIVVRKMNTEREREEARSEREKERDFIGPQYGRIGDDLLTTLPELSVMLVHAKRISLHSLPIKCFSRSMRFAHFVNEVRLRQLGTKTAITITAE